MNLRVLDFRFRRMMFLDALLVGVDARGRNGEQDRNELAEHCSDCCGGAESRGFFSREFAVLFKGDGKETDGF